MLPKPLRWSRIAFLHSPRANLISPRANHEIILPKFMWVAINFLVTIVAHLGVNYLVFLGLVELVALNQNTALR